MHIICYMHSGLILKQSYGLISDLALNQNPNEDKLTVVSGICEFTTAPILRFIGTFFFAPDQDFRGLKISKFGTQRL